MSEKRKYVSVILPLKLEWEPCYYLHAGIGADVVVGTRVMVRFAGKSYVGAVSATGIVPEVEDRKIMPILSVVEGLPPVSRGELELWRFCRGILLVHHRRGLQSCISVIEDRYGDVACPSGRTTEGAN